MARWLARRTISGTSVSQTPWERLTPPTASHSMDMLRISDCRTQAERRLNERDIETPSWSERLGSARLRFHSLRRVEGKPPPPEERAHRREDQADVGV